MAARGRRCAGRGARSAGHPGRRLPPSRSSRRGVRRSRGPRGRGDAVGLRRRADPPSGPEPSAGPTGAPDRESRAHPCRVYVAMSQPVTRPDVPKRYATAEPLATDAPEPRRPFGHRSGWREDDDMVGGPGAGDVGRGVSHGGAPLCPRVPPARRAHDRRRAAPFAGDGARPAGAGDGAVVADLPAPVDHRTRGAGRTQRPSERGDWGPPVIARLRRRHRRLTLTLFVLLAVIAWYR